MKTTSVPIQQEASLSKGYAIALTATFIWSLTAIFIGYLVLNYQMPAMVLALWRDALVFAGVWLVLRLIKPILLGIEKNTIGFFAAYGMVLALFNGTWTVSVALNGAAVATVLAYSAVAFTAVFGWKLYGERLGPIKITAVILSITGCVFVSGAYDALNWQINPIGVVTGLISGLAFGGYSLMGKEASIRKINPWKTLVYTFGFAALYLLVFNLLFPRSIPGGRLEYLLWLGASWRAWLVLFVLALGPTVGGYGLYTVSLTYLPASVAQLIATLEPLLTAIWAYFLLGERFTVIQIVGGVLIISGVVIIRLREGQFVEQLSLKRRSGVKQ